MIRQPIRNISSSKQIKPRVFDALIEGDDVNCVNSRDFATRAEIAAIFTRLLTKVM